MSHKILIADDHRDSAESLALLLQFLGHETRFALDGQEALRVAEQFHPDVIILDINMPKLDGYGVTMRLRELHDGEQQIIAMTAADKLETSEKAEQAGFDNWLVKPVDLEVLQRLMA